MLVIVAGSRDLDYDLTRRCIENSGFDVTQVMSGGAKGPDRHGERWAMWARARGLPLRDTVVVPANWNRYGRSAGHIRNVQMGRDADALIAVWDGKSPGTRDMIRIMADLEKPYVVFDAGGNRYSHADLVRLIPVLDRSRADSQKLSLFY